MNFYYKKDDKEKGPVSLDALVSLFKNGLLDSSVLVKKEGDSEWLPPVNFPELVGKIPDICITETDEGPDLKGVEEKVAVSPWIRFFARKFDYLIFGFAFVMLSVVFMPYWFRHSTLFDFLVLFLWIFVEAILVSLWGTTPGKWIFNLKIRDFNGDKLKIADAVKRSFWVWVKGIACGFPVISLITMFLSAEKLKKEGTTDWDYAAGSVVLGKKMGIFRIMFAVLFGVFFLIASFLAVFIH